MYGRFYSGIRRGHARAKHPVLVRDRRKQAQDGPAAVTHIPRHLPEGHHLQLPVQRPARPEDPARVPRLRSLLRRTSVSPKYHLPTVSIPWLVDCYIEQR